MADERETQVEAKRIKVCLPDKLFHVVPLRGSQKIKDLVTFLSERFQVEVKSLELLTESEDDGGALLRDEDEVIAALGENDYVLARPRNLAPRGPNNQADFTPLDGQMGNFEWNAAGKGKRKWRAYDAQTNDELTNAYNEQRGGGTTEIAIPTDGTAEIAATEHRYLALPGQLRQDVPGINRVRLPAEDPAQDGPAAGRLGHGTRARPTTEACHTPRASAIFSAMWVCE